VEPALPAKPEAAYRDYERARPGVREFYRENHARQTVDFVRGRHEAYFPLRRRRMGVFEAFDALAELVDASDPDLELSQLDHALQTAEAIRSAGAPRWLVLTGFVHDLGKVLCLFGEPQWAVVGDTFPVGCAFDPRIVHADLFGANPDARHAVHGSADGLYQPGCGLDALLLSFGHDEYLYRVLRPYLPEPALAIVRYHSFYAWHREGAYARFADASDAAKLDAVRRFNPYDLYSKSDERPDWGALRPYYEALVAEHLPAELQW
jgi:inositol oxygenase